MPDDTDLLTDALPPATAAFVAADAHTFAGRPLAPFSIRRQIAAQALGNKLLSGRARLEAPLPCRCLGHDKSCPSCAGTGERHGSYDGQFADVVGLLYLCACQDSEVLRAVREPAAVLDAAIGWAERQRLVLGSPRYLEACSAYHAILSDLQRSQFETVEDGATDPKKKAEPPPTPTSPNMSP
jgi:hypothetical protein